MDVDRIFREAVDEPAPPPPPEPREDDGHGDNRGPHIQVFLPRVILHEDWSTGSSGIVGSLVVAWCHLTSAVTLGLGVFLLLLYRDSLLQPVLYLALCGVALACLLAMGWMAFAATSLVARALGRRLARRKRGQP